MISPCLLATEKLLTKSYTEMTHGKFVTLPPAFLNLVLKDQLVKAQMIRIP